LSTCHGFLGHTLRNLRESASAVAAYERGIALDEARAAEWPNDVDIKIGLANHLLNLCTTLSSVGRGSEGEGLLRRAVDMLRVAYSLDPNSADARSELALGLGVLSRHVLRRKSPEAEDLARSALKLHDGLAKQFPKEPHHRHALAEAYILIGDIIS